MTRPPVTGPSLSKSAPELNGSALLPSESPAASMNAACDSSVISVKLDAVLVGSTA
jgi:hypothetical protein